MNVRINRRTFTRKLNIGHEGKRERIGDSVSKRRAAGKDLGGRKAQFTDSQIRNAARLIDSGQPAAHVARDLGMSRATLYRRMDALQAKG